MQTLLLTSLEIRKVIMKLKLLLSAFTLLCHVSQSFLTQVFFIFRTPSKQRIK